MNRKLRTSIILALLAGPAVLALELIRRAGTLGEVLGWIDDAIGAGLLVGAALLALRGRPGPLALAWAFGAGQLMMSLLGQLGHAGPDPSGQAQWLVVAIKALLLAGAATLAFATLRQLATQETNS
jgi:hypothetical protein